MIYDISARYAASVAAADDGMIFWLQVSRFRGREESRLSDYAFSFDADIAFTDKAFIFSLHLSFCCLPHLHA